MADQAITALPKKTYSGSSKIAATDYLLGIDSAEGYQMLIQDLGEYIINRVTASLAGSNQTLAAAISALNSKTIYNPAALSQIGTVLQYLNSLPNGARAYVHTWAVVSDMPSGLSDTMYNFQFVTDAANRNYDYVILTKVGTSEQWYGKVSSNDLTTRTLSWIKLPTRAEVDALKSKTVTVTGTTDSNGFFSTGLSMSNRIPLSVVFLKVDGTSKYSYFYQFLAWGGDPANQYAVQLKNWNGTIINGNLEVTIRYLEF